MIRRILRGFALGLAILILILEDAAWALFGPIANAIARLDLVARTEAWIRRQPAWAIAILFIVPLAIVYPAKILGLALMGFGRPRLGLVILIAAEIFGTLLLARLWIVGRDKLMTITWVAWVYGWIDAFRERIYGWVRRQPAWLAVTRLRSKVAVWLRP